MFEPRSNRNSLCLSRISDILVQRFPQRILDTDTGRSLRVSHRRIRRLKSRTLSSRVYKLLSLTVKA